MELIAGNFLMGIAGILDAILSLYFWIIIASAVLSWVNPDPYNPIVRIIRGLTEPAFYRVRKWLPFTYISGLDLSPVVLLLGIQFIKMFVVRSLYQFAGAM
ncbi:YggT family protein [Desulfovibrio psychrotolerans]|uniref:YggT family protein n=1 Tax=Desulfovibrio psychrotolerans TaxID=415242 RepID=A0A7J0BNT6_9BACT|nr:YggT family protein [Desulfovibrio psychrotolerans]GFM35346.1 YggT family protein [Desulfovibrio psychrotolerans]